MQKRAPVSTMSWILSLALLPFAGFVVYYFLGPQRLKKQRLKRLRSRASASSQADLARLRDAAQNAPPALQQMAKLGTATCGLPVSSALDVELLSGGARTFDAIFDAVRAAQDHIHLEYYIFEPDRIGTALRDLLIERAREGVTVRLLIDALGSKRIGRKFMAPMLEAGIKVALFHDTKIGRRLRPVTNYRTHRKIVVCDGRVGFTGGVNITDEKTSAPTPTPTTTCTCASKAVPCAGCRPPSLKTGPTPPAKTRAAWTTRSTTCCRSWRPATFRCRSSRAAPTARWKPYIACTSRPSIRPRTAPGSPRRTSCPASRR
ncbi:PLD-like domain-containing protein [Ditylenchus destructor]|uniref:PLD-like domain-containing protein n=1 Tax=Ditylenchus destructor TaxID=166010 RepID=A0AAD4MFF8_9BILA|nr:PLD-like domain-containing protein [Ditylenchus destructor]